MRDDGTVVLEVIKDGEMEVDDVPPALQQQLGPRGTAALVDVLEQARRDWTMDVTTAAIERFERRLTDAHAQLREDLIARDALLREDMIARDTQLRDDSIARDAQLREDSIARYTQLREDSIAKEAKLREDMLAREAKLRDDMVARDAKSREDMLASNAKVREDMAMLKFDLLKWSFAFWVGQIAAVATVVGVMLRTMQT